MVAPGDNLEFQASGEFRDRILAAPEILESAKEALRMDARRAGAIAGEFWSMDLSVGDAELVVFLRRRGNIVGFLAVFLKSETIRIEAKRRELWQKAQGSSHR